MSPHTAVGQSVQVCALRQIKIQYCVETNSVYTPTHPSADTSTWPSKALSHTNMHLKFEVCLPVYFAPDGQYETHIESGCFTALKQPHWPLISVLNWITCSEISLALFKKVFTFILNYSRETLNIKGAWMNAYKLSTHPLPCHLWPVQCSAVPSMLCKRSADRAVPEGSLSLRPVDTHHSAGTEVPERKNMLSNTVQHHSYFTQNMPGSFKILILSRKKQNTAGLQHLYILYC